jgi:lactoylglutathione lyase
MVGITEYDHVGIRVSDKDRAVAFYESLGFRVTGPDNPQSAALYLMNAAGLRIHLICNGAPAPANVLMDVADKWPGITHPAFIVDSLQAVLDWAEAHGVAITEGPVEWDDRRLTCFLRDPDGTVLEFNELLKDA